MAVYQDYSGNMGGFSKVTWTTVTRVSNHYYKELNNQADFQMNRIYDAETRGYVDTMLNRIEATQESLKSCDDSRREMLTQKEAYLSDQLSKMVNYDDNGEMIRDRDGRVIADKIARDETGAYMRNSDGDYIVGRAGCETEIKKNDDLLRELEAKRDVLRTSDNISNDLSVYNRERADLNAKISELNKENRIYREAMNDLPMQIRYAFDDESVMQECLNAMEVKGIACSPTYVRSTGEYVLVTSSQFAPDINQWHQDNGVLSHRYEGLTIERTNSASRDAGTGFTNPLDISLYATEAGSTQQKISSTHAILSGIYDHTHTMTDFKAKTWSWENFYNFGCQARNGEGSEVDVYALAKGVRPTEVRHVDLHIDAETLFKSIEEEYGDLFSTSFMGGEALKRVDGKIDLTNEKDVFMANSLALKKEILQKYEGLFLDKKGHFDVRGLAKMSKEELASHNMTELDVKILLMTEGEGSAIKLTYGEKFLLRKLANKCDAKIVSDASHLYRRTAQMKRFLQSTKQVVALPKKIHDKRIMTKENLSPEQYVSRHGVKKGGKRAEKAKSKAQKRKEKFDKKFNKRLKKKMKREDKIRLKNNHPSVVSKFRKKSDELLGRLTDKYKKSVVGKVMGKFNAIKMKIAGVIGALILVQVVLCAIVAIFILIVSTILNFFGLDDPKQTVAYKLYSELQAEERKWIKEQNKSNVNTTGITGTRKEEEVSSSKQTTMEYCSLLPNPEDKSLIRTIKMDAGKSMSVKSEDSNHNSNIKDILCMCDTVFFGDMPESEGLAQTQTGLGVAESQEAYQRGIELELEHGMFGRNKDEELTVEETRARYGSTTPSYAMLKEYCMRLFKYSHYSETTLQYICHEDASKFCYSALEDYGSQCNGCQSYNNFYYGTDRDGGLSVYVRADDGGFVNVTKKVQKTTDCCLPESINPREDWGKLSNSKCWEKKTETLSESTYSRYTYDLKEHKLVHEDGYTREILQWHCSGGHTCKYCGGHLKQAEGGIVKTFTEEQLREEAPIINGKIDTKEVNYETPEKATLFGGKTFACRGLNINVEDGKWASKTSEEKCTTENISKCADIFEVDCLIKYGATAFPAGSYSSYKDFEGWTEDQMSIAITKFQQDWEDLYGFSVPEITTTGDISAENIRKISESVKKKYGGLVTETRQRAIELALASVGTGQYMMPEHHEHCFKHYPCRRGGGEECNITDCSGFVCYIFLEVGAMPEGSVYATTGLTGATGDKVWGGWDSLIPGDAIVYHAGKSASGGGCAHALMFIGMTAEDLELDGLRIPANTPITVDCTEFGSYNGIYIRCGTNPDVDYAVSPDGNIGSGTRGTTTYVVDFIGDD